MKRAPALLLALLCGCRGDDLSALEAGVGGDRTGCGEPGSHSVELAKHSCACEDGYTWCSDALDEFECCPIEDTGTETDTGEPEEPPTAACDAELVEQLVCMPGPLGADDPGGATVWACNGERWVVVPGYSTFACLAEGFPFAYGCRPGDPNPEFLCGFGPGSDCDAGSFASLCEDEDIIDACVWGRRTVDRCSRLCAELSAFGEGFSTGACVQPDAEQPAVCACE